MNPLYGAELPVLAVHDAIALCNSFYKDLVLSVEGEVSGFSINRGTYVFFDLKDPYQEAKLGCFMMANQLSVPLEDGMRVRIQATPAIHGKSGNFRLNVKRVEPQGEGSLRRSFELLKQKLTVEGLFARDRKRPLPRFPRTVGVISSLQAAGYGDFMRIAGARLPGVQFTTLNVAVQGQNAEPEICQAFQHLNSHYDLDVIVVIRGGGSMDDLHAFNSEPVARAIAASKAPVLVGVGHERDVTIADYVADVRASTPSNAAQLLLPTKEEVVAEVQQLLQRGHRTVLQRIERQRQQIQEALRFGQTALLRRIAELHTATERQLRSIVALSPMATLARGYSLTTTVEGSLVRSIADVRTGSVLITQVADGTITSKVS